MIRSFRDAETEALFTTGQSRRWNQIARVACRKLAMLDAALSLEDLKYPPGNHLEALKKDRIGQHSIRVNGQFRVCFEWTPQGPTNVEIVDYH
jgi:proteic killer suppression protein